MPPNLGLSDPAVFKASDSFDTPAQSSYYYPKDPNLKLLANYSIETGFVPYLRFA